MVTTCINQKLDLSVNYIGIIIVKYVKVSYAIKYCLFQPDIQLKQNKTKHTCR